MLMDDGPNNTGIKYFTVTSYNTVATPQNLAENNHA